MFLPGCSCGDCETCWVWELLLYAQGLERRALATKAALDAGDGDGAYSLIAIGTGGGARSHWRDR